MLPRSKMSVKDLQSKITNMDQARFNLFKLYIRTKARKEFTFGGVARQDPARWSRFKSQITREFPELLEYDDQWPVEAYFQFVSFESCHPRNKNGIQLTTPKTPPKRRITFFAGGTPHHRPRCNTRPATHHELQTIQKALYPLHLVATGAFSNMANTVAADIPEGICSSTSNLSDTVEVINNQVNESSVSISHGNSNSMHYPAPCVRCGAIPEFPPSYNKEISGVLLGQDTLISVFSSLGIVSDHHLSILRQWDSATFLNSLNDSIISPLHKAYLKKYLRADAAKQARNVPNGIFRTPSSPKFKPLSFQQPSPQHEAHIIQSSSSDELRKAMGLDDDMAHYILLTKYIDDAIEGMHIQLEQGEWNAIVNRICDDCPELRKFQNTWPIAFYLEWKHARLCSERLQKIMPLQFAAYSSTRSRKLNQADTASGGPSPQFLPKPGTPWSGCGIHPLPRALDAPTKLLNYLRNFGMEELLSLFLSAGIKTDGDFDLYSDLDEEERKSVFDLFVKDSNLRPFQRMMLDVMMRYTSVTGL